MSTKDNDHHNFYFSLTISVILTIITTIILTSIDYSYLHDILDNSILLWLTVLNNIYQVYAHIFTGTKFMGYKQISPPGSQDNQTLLSFTVSNIFDILGWMGIFVYYGYANPILALLASGHYGTGIISIFFNKTFQEYFIELKFNICNKIRYWQLFRVCFVFTDAIARGYVVYLIITNNV